MKTDRELLEMAAKAAGIDVTQQDDGSFGYYGDWRGLPQWEHWNPLIDDGDALRLATRLRISVSTGPCIAAANTIEGALRGAFFKESTVGVNHDAAVRRVIVQAAAEIGKHIP